MKRVQGCAVLNSSAAVDQFERILPLTISRTRALMSITLRSQFNLLHERCGARPRCRHRSTRGLCCRMAHRVDGLLTCDWMLLAATTVAQHVAPGALHTKFGGGPARASTRGAHEQTCAACCGSSLARGVTTSHACPRAVWSVDINATGQGPARGRWSEETALAEAKGQAEAAQGRRAAAASVATARKFQRNCRRSHTEQKEVSQAQAPTGCASRRGGGKGCAAAHIAAATRSDRSSGGAGVQPRWTCFRLCSVLDCFQRASEACARASL